jgi:REP element-mobilizing transposase RayT
MVHVIFSTKGRLPLLQGDLPRRLFAYIHETARRYGGVIHIIDGVADHVHMLMSIPADRSVAEIMRLVKCNSSRWVRQEFTHLRDFGWQTGYAAFSVSHSKCPAVHEYIARQQEHHKTLSFKEEVVAFLRKHEIEYDERYILD